MTDNDKQLAARTAAAEVEQGMLVGLGTGSTAAHAIAALGERVAQGLAIRAVATSQASARQALSLGIPLLDFADVPTVDLTIDGADEIDPQLRAIKGAGGAMVREKAVAAASARMIVIADGTKRVEQIGALKLPVEVLSFARSFVWEQLIRLGGEPQLRMAGGDSYRTDNGNIVADCRFAQTSDWPVLAATLDAFPGVIGHGLFLTEVDAAVIAADGIVTRLERGDASA